MIEAPNKGQRASEAPLPKFEVIGVTNRNVYHCAGKRKGGPIPSPQTLPPKMGPLADSVAITISKF